MNLGSHVQGPCNSSKRMPWLGREGLLRVQGCRVPGFGGLFGFRAAGF